MLRGPETLLRMGAETFSTEQLEKLNECFCSFEDRRGSGVVPKGILGDLLRTCGQNPTDEEVETVFGRVDGDDVDFTKFLELLSLVYKSPEAMEQEMVDAFRAMDTNGDGTISAEEFANMLRGQGLDEDSIKIMLSDADANADGIIDYKEFTQFMLSWEL